MSTKPKKFEDELKELEAIVSQIDSGELTLEESIGAFERGVMLVKALNGKLDLVEFPIERLHQHHAAFESSDRFLERKLTRIDLAHDRFELLELILEFFCLGRHLYNERPVARARSRLFDI